MASLIIQATFTLIYLAVFVWQFNLIKTFKSKIEVLEKFQNIFKAKDIEDYADLLRKKHDLEIEQVNQKLIRKLTIDVIKDEYPGETFTMSERFSELVHVFCRMMIDADKKAWDILLEELPLNKVLILEVFEKWHKPTP